MHDPVYGSCPATLHFAQLCFEFEGTRHSLVSDEICTEGPLKLYLKMKSSQPRDDSKF